MADVATSTASGDQPQPPPQAAPQKLHHPPNQERVAARPQPPPQAAPQKLSGKSLHRAQAVLSKHLFYPQPAVDQGLQGDVVLLLALDSKGGIQAIEIAKSSGHALLDQAAIDAARHIGVLPGNPRQTLLPVSFRLR